jgi:hypothetical protein
MEFICYSVLIKCSLSARNDVQGRYDKVGDLRLMGPTLIVRIETSARTEGTVAI